MKKILSLLFVLIFLFSVKGFAENEPFVSAPEELLTVDCAAAVTVSARAYALMDVNTGTLLAAGNEHERLYPASVTKIMSLILFCEAIEQGKYTLNEKIICSESASAKGGSQIWLEPGEEMSVNDLLKAVVVASANDACTLLAEKTSGSEDAFVKMMNEKARALGMDDTYFDNCSGLDDKTSEHLSSAYDIAIMSRELLGHKIIRDYTAIWTDELRNGATQLVNTNRLIRYYPGATGLKTGTTSKAGCCISASAERDGMELIAVIMGASGSSDRFNSAKELLDFGFANYEILRPEPDRSLLEPVPVVHGTAKEVVPVCLSAADILVNKGVADCVTQTVNLPEYIEAPVEKGAAIGTLTFSAKGSVLAEYDITAENNVEKMNFRNAWLTILGSFAA